MKVLRQRKRTFGTSRRGIAMMLVLVAMVVTVVLTSAAIVSRETSPAIGANSATSVAASWSAESAANYAVGALADGLDWASVMAVDGTLIENMTIGCATVQVTLTTMDGGVPGPDDRDLIMIANAEANGITTTVRRAISLGEPGEPIDAIDLMMGEFSLLGVNELSVASTAKIGPWPLSPESATRPQFKLGTAFASPSYLSVNLTGALGPVEMYIDQTGGAGLASEVAGTGYSTQWQMPVDLPVLEKGVPPAVLAFMGIGGTFEPAALASVNLPGTKNYTEIRIRNSATATIDGTTPVALRCDRLELNEGTLRVVGDVSILVRDRVRVENSSAIALADASARLRIYVCNEVNVTNDSQIGVVMADVGRVVSDLTTWVSPNQVQIFEVGTSQGGSGSASIRIQNRAIVLGALHAPGADLIIETNGVLIGRATANRIDVKTNAKVLYDPTLDTRLGFTNPTGPLYDDPTTMNPIVEAALADAVDSGVTRIDDFYAVLETAYEDQKALALVDGVVDLAGGVVQESVNLFTGLLGIK